MKTFFIVALGCAAGSYLCGIFFSYVVENAPFSFLGVQANSGGPPRLVAVLALAPIAVLVAVVGFKKVAKWKSKDIDRDRPNDSLRP